MKLLVIGLGQCGGRIADEFARMNRRARVKRGVDIITDAFAVNTDIADLSGLSLSSQTTSIESLSGVRRQVVTEWER